MNLIDEMNSFLGELVKDHPTLKEYDLAEIGFIAGAVSFCRMIDYISDLDTIEDKEIKIETLREDLAQLQKKHFIKEPT